MPDPQTTEVKLTRMGYGDWFRWVDQETDHFENRICAHEVPIMKCCVECDYERVKENRE
jgi:hypothetical protein